MFQYTNVEGTNKMSHWNALNMDPCLLGGISIVSFSIDDAPQEAGTSSHLSKYAMMQLFFID